jgi:hypothetical protein
VAVRDVLEDNGFDVYRFADHCSSIMRGFTTMPTDIESKLSSLLRLALITDNEGGSYFCYVTQASLCSPQEPQPLGEARTNIMLMIGSVILHRSRLDGST